MKNHAATDPHSHPDIRSAGRLLLCIGLAVVFGALAAIAAFVVGFLLMAALGGNRTGPLLMLLGTPAAFVVGAWLGWRWARRTVAASDGR
jgi:hypothetical protein